MNTKGEMKIKHDKVKLLSVISAIILLEIEEDMDGSIQLMLDKFLKQCLKEMSKRELKKELDIIIKDL